MAADTVEQIKAKLTITDVVGGYVKLARAGRYMRGLSPFNKEKTPSFYVNPERGSYYCFSSSQGGDMFTFIEKMEGVDFKGALKILAEKAGVELVYQKGGSADKGKLDRLREALARAEAFYAASLDPKGPAYAYALSRGLAADTIAAWNLGLAPDSWRSLLEKLSADGFTNQELIAAGLVKEADGKKGTWYDRFRNRLMFPIRDSAGRTVAFTGRALDANDQAKYLNSPETDLYKKHEILFGMDKAKDAIRTRGFAILVEGQMDLLMLHQVGFQNTVALSGTALSKEHLALMKRYADNLMLALDADRAGLAAAQKSAIAALASGMRVKAVSMPQGKDPADVAKEDPKDFAKRVSGAKPIVEFFLEVLQKETKDTHKLILETEKIIAPIVHAIQSPMEREHFMEITSRALGLSQNAVREAMRQDALVTVKPVSLSITTNQPTIKVTEKLPVNKKWEKMIHASVLTYPNTDVADYLIKEYIRVVGKSLPEDEPEDLWLFEVQKTFGDAPSLQSVQDLIRELEKSILNLKREEAERKLRHAELGRNTAEINEATQQIDEVLKELRRL